MKDTKLFYRNHIINHDDKLFEIYYKSEEYVNPIMLGVRTSLDRAKLLIDNTLDK